MDQRQSFCCFPSCDLVCVYCFFFHGDICMKGFPCQTFSSSTVLQRHGKWQAGSFHLISSVLCTLLTSKTMRTHLCIVNCVILYIWLMMTNNPLFLHFTLHLLNSLCSQSVGHWLHKDSSKAQHPIHDPQLSGGCQARLCYWLS